MDAGTDLLPGGTGKLGDLAPRRLRRQQGVHQTLGQQAAQQPARGLFALSGAVQQGGQIATGQKVQSHLLPRSPEQGGLEAGRAADAVMGEEQVVLPDGIRGQRRGKPGLRQADAHRQADARQIVVQPAGRHAEGGQCRSVFHKAVPQCLGQAEAAARGPALRPGGTAQGQHQTAAAPEALRRAHLEARAIKQGRHVMHVGLAVESAALTTAILYQGIQQTLGRDSQEQLAVGAFLHGQAPAVHQSLHVLRREGI